MTRLLLVVLVALQIALLTHTARRSSLTVDEQTYLASSHAFVAVRARHLLAEAPPLAKWLTGTAMAIHGATLPLSHESFQRSARGDGTAQWEFGQAYLAQFGERLPAAAFAARIPTIAVSVLLLLCVFGFARTLHGNAGGLLAAALVALWPSLLAHGSLATTDMLLTTATTATLWTWLLVTRDRIGRTSLGIACGLALGFALTAKFTGLLLLPVLVLHALTSPFLDGTERTRCLAELRRRLASLALVAAIAAAVVMLVYATPAAFAEYSRGMRRVNAFLRADYATYFAGTFTTGRIPHYFVAAVALKTPLSILALLAIAVLGDLRRRVLDRSAVTLIATFVVGLLVVVGLRAFQIGERYVLPVHPLLAVLAAGAIRAPWLVAHPRTRRTALAVLLGLLATSTLRQHPNHLGYVHELARHGDGTIEWLDDSNVDWGHALPALRDWLDAHDVDDVHLLPVTDYAPHAYGIPARRLAFEDLVADRLPAGVSAISVHVLNRARHAAARTEPLRVLYPPIAIVGGAFWILRR